MTTVQEIPPTIVLQERSHHHLLFRFRNVRWAIGTLALGIVLISATAWFHFTHAPRLIVLAGLYGFGVLLLYSALYSFTADQFLVVEGGDRSVRFHKKNLYGTVEWKRQADQFRGIRVFRPMAANHRRGRNWAIALMCPDQLELFLGENEFGSVHRERAVALAEDISLMTGIQVTAESS